MVLSLTRPNAGDVMLLSNGKAQTVILDDIMDAIEALDTLIRSSSSGGPVVLTGGATTMTLISVFTQPDSLYQLMLDLSWQTTWVATNKTTTGLTVAFGVPVPTGGGSVWWRVER
jgi:hypothetical protein